LAVDKVIATRLGLLSGPPWLDTGPERSKKY